ncbi:MAG: VIT and VWA domain-containing protein [Gallionella sp.]|nr:VIT and VWA domain-containing protein [Gallionella sp.]
MPKTEENLAILKDRKGGDVALKGVKISGRLHGLMAEVEVEQTYANPQITNIEAIYTFPLPLGATLLGLEVDIAGKKLAGSVVEKKQAERQYEDAITDGDSAIMLEEVGPGLYTVSLGNLMAGESAVIRYRYALLLSWQGDRLRFLLPTTIAPRYGDPQAAGLQPHQVPSASLNVDYPLAISITVKGDLASATIASPSHPITIQQSPGGVVVQLSGKTYLDRDFILTIQSDTAQSSCLLTQDREKQVALASLRIPAISAAEELPLALKVVIDCSGSMAGTSIAQARKAALEILNLLRPEDSFNVTIFGNNCSHIFPKLVMASAKNITQAWNRLEMLAADMGGTEMEKALDAVFSLGDAEGATTVLLITDGEIHEHEKLVQRAKKSGHRVFTVGVGDAVAETFLKTLASVTGGASELISSQEGMAERVLAQFHRLRQPRLGDLRIEWPVTPEWQTPLPDNVFAGDTVQVFAGFLQAVEGSVKLVVPGADEVTSTIVPANETEIPRMAAARRINLLSENIVRPLEAQLAYEDNALQLALDYQLLTRWTNFLVVVERTDKADDLPVLHQVPQMLAAGWGGVGNDEVLYRCSNSHRSSSVLYSEVPAYIRSGRRAAIDALDIHTAIDALDTPSFLRKKADEPNFLRMLMGGAAVGTTIPVSSTPATFIENFAYAYTSFLRHPKIPTSVAELLAFAIDEDVACGLQNIVALGHDEAEVVAAFIYALSQSAIGDKFSRSFKREILKHWKQIVQNHEIDVEMQNGLASVTADSWNWQTQVA